MTVRFPAEWVSVFTGLCIKELERTVGRKQIMIDYLEKMMEIAKDELDIDIKKNFGTPQSTGSGKTSKK